MNLFEIGCATVDAKAFSAALKKVSAILKRSSVPVLEGVYARFTSGHCVLTATDMDTWITVDFPASGDDFALVFSRIEAIERVSRFFDGKVSLSLMDERVNGHSNLVITLSCGARKAEFDAYPAEDYPDIPKMDGDPMFSANAEALLERVSKVSYAVRKSSQEYMGRDTCIQFSGNRIAALDGYRAAWDIGETQFSPEPFLVYEEPLKCLKVFGNTEVTFHFSKNRIFVTDNSTTIICRKPEGEPYDLERAIPQKFSEEFLISPKRVLDELRYLKNVTPKSRTPYVYLRGKELFMTVNGRKYSTAVEIERRETQTMGFDLRYLTDALRQFEKEPFVTIRFSGNHSPIVIETESRSDCAMVLPVRVKENAAA